MTEHIQILSKPNRQINIELLRILSMFFIVCNHFLGFGLSLQDYDMSDPHRYALWFLRGVCYTGTNIFILISAYFQCMRIFKIKSLLLIVCQVWFYSTLIYLLSILFGLTEFSYNEMLTSIFPILSSSYWFVTCYVGLYILSPFINKFISNLTKTQHLTLLVILFIFFSAIPNFCYNSSWLNWGGSTGIVWFVFLYLVAAYLRFHIDISNVSMKKLTALLVLFMLLPLLSKVIIANLTYYLTGTIIGSSLFFMNNSVIIFPLSILLFLTFMKIKISNRGAVRVISYVASSVFAIYLISEHPQLREYIWDFSTEFALSISMPIPISVILITCAIMLLCIAIDQIRKFVFFMFSKTGIPQKIADFLSVYPKRIYTDL